MELHGSPLQFLPFFECIFTPIASFFCHDLAHVLTLDLRGSRSRLLGAGSGSEKCNIQKASVSTEGRKKCKFQKDCLAQENTYKFFRRIGTLYSFG